ncbi:MAG: ATPase involved in chromosome partitioning [uncultured archaeon A07HR67]|nr:MAG: ATPase involved in chromosome partitioning [uncultured archaeon A07HR67]
MPTVYAVGSAKGGVGKTTTAAAVATVLAAAGADVVAVDADVGMANLAGALGVTPGDTTVHDVLAGRAPPDAAVHDGPDGLRVVPGDTDLDAYAAADPTALARVVGAFDDADYVIVDAGAGLSHAAVLPLGLADQTLLVSTPDRSALGDTEKTRQLAERIGASVAGAAITRVDAGGAADPNTTDAPDATDTPDGAAIDVVGEVLAAPVLGRIPEDPVVSRAAAAGRPLTAFDPRAPASRAYRDLTRALTGVDVGAETTTGDEPHAAPSTRETVAATDDWTSERTGPGPRGDPNEGASADADTDKPADRGRADASARDAGPMRTALTGTAEEERAEGDEEDAGTGGFVGWLLGR